MLRRRVKTVLLDVPGIDLADVFDRRIQMRAFCACVCGGHDETGLELLLNLEVPLIEDRRAVSGDPNFCQK